MPLGSRRRRLTVPAAVFGDCLRDVTDTFPFETGGVLLGGRANGDFVVSTVVGAGPAARHSRSTFEPDQDWQSDAIARLWNDHGGGLEYLGDWHSHPGGLPRPSGRDRDVLELIAADTGARCPTPVMLIIAIDSSGRVRPAAFGLFGTRVRPVVLALTGVATER